MSLLKGSDQKAKYCKAEILEKTNARDGKQSSGYQGLSWGGVLLQVAA